MCHRRSNESGHDIKHYIRLGFCFLYLLEVVVLNCSDETEIRRIKLTSGRHSPSVCFWRAETWTLLTQAGSRVKHFLLESLMN